MANQLRRNQKTEQVGALDVVEFVGPVILISVRWLLRKP
jgi:hypothetical protein